MPDTSYKVKSDGKLYVGLFKGSLNSGPMRTYISIGDDEEPGIGEWLTIPEAKRLVAALQKCIDKAMK